MWIPHCILCFTALTVYSQVTTAETNFQVKKLIESINKDGNSNLTNAEVEAFYGTLGGPPVTRCAFTKSFKTYTEDPGVASTMFDVIKSNDGPTLALKDFKKSLLASADQATVDSVQSRLIGAALVAELSTSSPNLYTETPGFFEATDFQVDKLAKDFDKDKNGKISKEEVTQGMIGLMDENGDKLVDRCEFVDSMKKYKLHPGTATKVYDILFKGRDRTWEDKDSNALIEMVDIDDDGSVSLMEFKRFFAYQNLVASGLQSRGDLLLLTANEGMGLVFGGTGSSVWLLVQTLVSFLLVLQITNRG